MDTSKLKKFAQFARRTLIGQVSAKLQAVVAESSAARREHPEAMRKLEAAIAKDGKDQVIERVAYTWFNRFSALRFMDVNDLNPVRVVSPVVGQFQPEILAEAKAGNMNENRVPDKVRDQIHSLLDGRTPSADAQTEAYRLLIVAICNDWHRAMPFLFERIDDFTELLLPDDLLSNASILAYMREAMTPDVCEDVEVIGWLYQFYISEKKDEVFAGLKKNKKITAENIPAATQLFTPHWIVRYLVENSLGRLWLLNRPSSRLAERMDYYIAPEEPETDFLKVSKPAEIKICDPACGSGHMLTYAFDLLYAIYEEEGYDPSEIPSLILTHNLFGIEIDERAGALAAFALTMKAASRRKRFLRNPVQPNVCVLENVSFTPQELTDYMAEVGRDLFTTDLRQTLGQFEDVKNCGSLIVPALKDSDEIQRLLAAKQFEGNLFLRDVHSRVLTVVNMATSLSAQYHVLVANPPYMGGANMAPPLKKWLDSHYPVSKQDLMTAFMERAATLSLTDGYWGMINLPAWMFLGAYEKMRAALLRQQSFASLLHLGRGIFGADFGSTAFVMRNSPCAKNTKALFFRTYTNHVDVRSPVEIEQLFLSRRCDQFSVIQDDLLSIPGTPIAYWINDAVRRAFRGATAMSDSFDLKTGIIAGNNAQFIRSWPEVAQERLSPAGCEPNMNSRWFPLYKGGERRKWYGNLSDVVDYSNEGGTLARTENAMLRNRNFYFLPGVHWNRLSNEYFGARVSEQGCIFEDLSPSLFGPSACEEALPLLNAKTTRYFIRMFSSGRKTEIGHVGSVPLPDNYDRERTSTNACNLVSIARSDWDSTEISLTFSTLPLLLSEFRHGKLKTVYALLHTHWRSMVEEMQRLEEENNRIFIDAYGLQNELSPEVHLDEITLNCNPAFRYGGKKSAAELEDLLCGDTMREFLSYAVGCMFGRYSLDAPGLILANQGEGLEDYLSKVPSPTFEPDADNVIPMLDGDWFADDITERFRKFLRVTFGEEHFAENLAFIEQGLGKDVRRYFTRDFFNDHVKRYKKRPIYWLFSSPKGSFNVLIYMHRYRPDTVSVVLNDYLREYRNKLEAHRKSLEALSINPDASVSQRTKALKDVGDVTKTIEELDGYERDVLYPLATQKIEIDLDDGVKANYPKFGAALKPIKGLSDADD